MHFCLYRMYDADGQLLYIGQTIRFAERMIQHSESKEWWPPARIETQQFATAEELNEAEKTAIQTEKPLHNIVYNRQTTYPRTPKQSSTKHRSMIRRHNDYLEPIDVSQFVEEWDHYVDGFYYKDEYVAMQSAMMNLAKLTERWTVNELGYFDQEYADSILMGVVVSIAYATRFPMNCENCHKTLIPILSYRQTDDEGFIGYTKYWHCSDCQIVIKMNGRGQWY